MIDKYQAEWPVGDGVWINQYCRTEEEAREVAEREGGEVVAYGHDIEGSYAEIIWMSPEMEETVTSFRSWEFTRGRRQC